MTALNSINPESSPKKPTTVGTGAIVMVLISIVLCVISLNFGLSAISRKGGHDFASIGYWVLGVPSLGLQAVLAPSCSAHLAAVVVLKH